MNPLQVFVKNLVRMPSYFLATMQFGSGSRQHISLVVVSWSRLTLVYLKRSLCIIGWHCFGESEMGHWDGTEMSDADVMNNGISMNVASAVKLKNSWKAPPIFMQKTNIKYNTSKKIGTPRTLFNTILSILSENEPESTSSLVQIFLKKNLLFVYNS